LISLKKCGLQQIEFDVRFKVLTAVTTKIIIFWDTTAHDDIHQHFGGTRCLQLLHLWGIFLQNIYHSTWCCIPVYRNLYSSIMKHEVLSMNIT
jgi:hypothetical protein